MNRTRSDTHPYGLRTPIIFDVPTDANPPPTGTFIGLEALGSWSCYIEPLHPRVQVSSPDVYVFHSPSHRTLFAPEQSHCHILQNFIMSTTSPLLDDSREAATSRLEDSWLRCSAFALPEGAQGHARGAQGA